MSFSRSIGSLYVINIVNASVGVANLLVTSAFFGASRELELYFVASALQMSLMRLMMTGQLSEIFLPQYHEIKSSIDERAAHNAFSVLLNWVIIAAVLIGVIAYAVSPWIVGWRVPGFSDHDVALGVDMFRYIIPLLVIGIISSTLRIFAHAEKQFRSPALANVFGSVLNVTCMIVFAGKYGIWALVIGLWVHVACVFINILVIIYRLHYRHSFRLHSDNITIAIVTSKLGYAAGFTGTNELLMFTRDAALSFLPQGVFAMYVYVEKIYAKVSGVVLSPIGTVFFTYYSESRARLKDNCDRLLRKSIDHAVGISFICIAFILFSSDEILRALFGLNTIANHLFIIAGFLLMMEFFSLLPSGMRLIYRKLYASIGDVRRMYVALAIGRLLLVPAAWVLITDLQVLGVGIYIILCPIVGMSICILMLKSVDTGLILSPSLSNTIKWLLSISAAYLCGTLLSENILFLPLARLEFAAYAAVVSIATGSTCLLVARLLGIEDARKFLEIIFRKLGFPRGNAE